MTGETKLILQEIKNLHEEMNDRFEQVDQRFEQNDRTWDQRLRESENLILSEVERVRAILEGRIDKLQENMDELNQYYRINKLEDDEQRSKLEARLEKVENRVDILETKVS